MHEMHEMNATTRREPVLGRRELLRIGAVGALGALGAAGTAGLVGLSSLERAVGECVTSAAQTEGPYWVDERLLRSDVRADPSTGAVQVGMPLRLTISVAELQGGVCSPVEGGYVDIWHCSATGAYSDVSAGAGNPNTLGQRWLRGYQVTDAHGSARFLTVYPGWYQGRTVHIHFRVRKFSGATVTFNFVSQLYFEDAISNAIYASTAPYSSRTNRNPASNAQDNIYRPSLLLRMSRNRDHVVASFQAVINAEVGVADHRTTPTDEDSLEHLWDFGGGSPRLTIA